MVSAKTKNISAPREKRNYTRALSISFPSLTWDGNTGKKPLLIAES
jgi:hypothetical protein